MTDTVNVPLLPCPFCGSALKIRKGVNPYGHCPTEGCYSNRAQIVCLDVPEQVTAWNSRASLAAAPKAEPGLKAQVRSIDETLSAFDVMSAHFNLTQPKAPKVEQEPVAWIDYSHQDGLRWKYKGRPPADGTYLYTHPAPASDELLVSASLISRLLANSVAHYGNPKDEDFGVGATHKEARDFIAKHKEPQS